MKKISFFVVTYLFIYCLSIMDVYAIATKNCAFKAERDTDGVNIVFSTNPNNHDDEANKRGVLYTFDSNGNELFCLIPNKGVAPLYDMSDTPVPKSGIEKYYYIIYGWYKDGPKTEYRQQWAQIAAWYVAYCVKEGKTPNAQELGVAYTTGTISLYCYKYEDKIRLYLNNPNFSCSQYFSPFGSYQNNLRVDCRGTTSCSVFQYSQYFNLFTTSTTYSTCNQTMGCTEENEIKYYGMYYLGVPTRDLNLWYNGIKNRAITDRCPPGVTYTDGLAYAANCAMSYEVDHQVQGNSQYAYQILTHEPYGDDLYYWYPSNYPKGSKQTLLGIKGCDIGTPACQDELDEVVEPFKPNLTSSNTAYKTALETFRQSHLDEIEEEWLSNDSWLANPKCKPPVPDGLLCYDDLEILNSKTKGTSEYDTQHNLMLSRNDEYVDGKYNGNYDTPDCKDIDDRCYPDFSYDDCDNFTNINNGFRIADTSDEDCWQNKNKAFTTSTNMSESRWAEASNRYCNVYCWEAAGADFPGAIKDIQAGQRFFWGRGSEYDGYFGNINASRKCITKNINYQLYYNDVVVNEAAISSAYNQWLAEKRFNEQDVQDGGSCDYYDNSKCNSTSGVPEHWELVVESSTCNGHIATSNGCTSETGSKPCNCMTQDGVKGWYYKVNATSGNSCSSCKDGYHHNSSGCYTDGTKYYREEKTTNGVKIDKKEECFKNGTDATTISNSLKVTNDDTTLKSYLNQRTSIQKEINDCQSNGQINYDPDHGNTNMYTYSTTVKLTYGEKFWNGGASTPSPKSISADDLLIQDGQVYSFSSSGNRGSTSILTTDGVTQTGVENVVTICTSVDDYPNDGTNNKYGCNDSNLYFVPVYSDYTWNFAGYWKYYYNDQYFVWHFLKQSGIAKMKKEVTTTTTDFMFGGKYGFIASFNMVTNFYSFATVEVKNFGNNGHFNELFYELSADYTEDRTSTDTYTYICPFHIENKMYGSECHYDCDFDTKICKLDGVSPEYCKNKVGGIDLVYRIIELTSAEKAAAGNKEIVFPGLVGTGRKLGSNWETFYNNNREKYNKITTYDNIYDGGAIYVIDLTPAAIQAIRADNAEYRAKKKDPYTSMKDPDNNQKIKCTGETPQEQTCVSTWITGLRNGKVGATDIGVKLTGEYGELDTDARLAAIKRAKESTEASGTKNLLSTGGV